MDWSPVVKEAIVLLRKLGGAIAAFFAGRASKQSEIDKADKKALEKELDNEHAEDAILSDPSLLQRMRDRFKKQ